MTRRPPDPIEARRFAHYTPDRIRAVVGFEDLTESVARALVDRSRGLGASPVTVFAPRGNDGDVHVKCAWLPGRAIFTVKVATWFAARIARGDPPSAGFVAVFDAETGVLLALLEDDHHLSDVRTAAAGALATRMLARPDAATLGVLGTGVQAYLQVLAAASERPIRHVKVWGRNPERGARLIRAVVARRPDLSVTLSPTAQAACRGADVVVTATSSREPLIEPAWLEPGIHITAVGADDAEKCELAPGCLARADRIVVDSRELTKQYGDLARAIAAGVIGGEQRLTELGELLANTAPGRAGEEEITVCKLVGLGVQDLAAAEVSLARLEAGTVPAWPPASATDLQ
jgi:ornithine cyclodeaminase/alanine dehydrogenase-like protein (mu-crystallin family)